MTLDLKIPGHNLTKKGLGRLIITIDDIKRLQTLMAEGSNNVRLYYRAGWRNDDDAYLELPDAEDLAELPHRELSDIILSDHATFILRLSRRKATLEGSTQQAGRIQDWARNRLARGSDIDNLYHRPWPYCFLRMIAWPMSAILMIAVMTLGGLNRVPQLRTIPYLNWILGNPGWTILVTAGYLILILLADIILTTRSSAVIVPLTLRELRQRRSGNAKYWGTTVIAICSAVISLVALIISSYAATK